MLKKFAVSVLFACGASLAFSQTPVECSNISVGSNGALNGFVPSPNDAWHHDVTNAPIDPSSAKIITTSGDLLGAYLHPNFGSIAGGSYGIPYTVVDSQQTPSIAVPITLYPADSDITLIPVPASLPVEGYPGECPTAGDRHALIIDRNKCVVYELYQAAKCTNGWSASDVALFDLTETEQRPYSYTSADAAGLSVFEGLIRYDEIVAGVINHAIRFTAKYTKDDANNGYFTAPATHASGNLWGTDNIMGMRIRLKASFDISGFSSTNQIILKAMKQYGMILADNGSNLYFEGTPDSRWSDTDLNALKAVPSTAFDVIQMGPVYDATTAPTGSAPVITSFTASATTVSSGTSVILTPTVTGASYSYIDKAGFTRGPITVTPTATTTYTLTSRNAYGTTSRSVTVTVQSGTVPTLRFTAVPTQTFGVAAFAVNATSNSTGAITYSVVSGPATITGNTVSLTGAGSVSLQASQAAAGAYTTATAQTTFAVSSGSPALTVLSIPSQTLGAAPIVVSTTTKSSGSIAYSVVSGPATISGNTVTLTGAGTVTLQANQAAAGNYTSAIATMSFSVTQTSTTAPRLALVANYGVTFGTAPFPVSASSASTGAITYSVASGPGTISGNTVTLTGGGTLVVQASQAAAGIYKSASVTMSIPVRLGASGLAFVPIPAETYGIAPFAISATTKSEGNITYSVISGPATISGNIVTVSAVGLVSLQMAEAATANYAAATVSISFRVNPETPTLVISQAPNQTMGSPPLTLSATSNSPAPITYSVIKGWAVISGNTATLAEVGPLTIYAHQAAVGNYAAAAATMTLSVAAEPVTLTFAAIPSKTFGLSGPFGITASSASAAPATYSVISGPATISGRTVTLTGTGQVTLRASQAASGGYAAGTGTTNFVVQ